MSGTAERRCRWVKYSNTQNPASARIANGCGNGRRERMSREVGQTPEAIGEKARAWKGNKAGYIAKHMWMKKHWGKPDHCDHCHTTTASRYEWANINHGESRERTDYIQLCPSCHRLFDYQNKCRKGHLYTPETTITNKRGHRRCLICKKEAQIAKAN